METFDPRNIKCPYCQEKEGEAYKNNLRVFEDNGKIIGYIHVPGCGSSFEPDYRYDFEHGVIYYLVKRRNPDYLAKLNSGDFFENLKKGEELDRMGVPFYSGTYLIGSKRFDEN